MIQPGELLPDVQFQRLTDNGVVTQSTAELFKGEKVVLFAVPGAFTPTCSAAHLPGFVELQQQFYDKGVDRIICLSVNDAYVMDAWGKAHNAGDILMLADGAGKFAQAIGLAADTGDFGGLRSRRYAMLVDDGVVTQLQVDEPKQFEVSKAEVMLALL
ncbi:peroxiredoxin [Rheinheimera sp.]|uniref:peroxiredoxin n=1 Tax=Rheinheimera sp. TaxID=1869214 RepID=UPI00307CDE3A